MFCYQCGCVLEHKECGDEGMVPYCPSCQTYRFDPFGCAVLVCILNPDQTKICLLQQNYVHQNHAVLVAGYVKKGETLEQTVHREVMEETGLTLSELTYVTSFYHEKSQSLMAGFWGISSQETVTKTSQEVDDIKWVSLDQAGSLLKEKSTGQKLFLHVLDLIKNK